MSKPILKPCPYCAMENPIFDYTLSQDAWRCSGCGMSGPWYDSTGHKWNSLPRDCNDSSEKLIPTVDQGGAGVVS
jgi:hypothetical protein